MPFHEFMYFTVFKNYPDIIQRNDDESRLVFL